jgi:transcriptional regulator with XRE-family HTH domain
MVEMSEEEASGGATESPKQPPPWSETRDAMQAARAERGVSVKQLAGELRTQHALISMIENGEELPERELAGRIRAWLSSGKGVRAKSPSGPHRKTYSEDTVQRQKRSTIDR